MREFLSNLTWLGPRGRRVVVICVIVLTVVALVGLLFNRQIRNGYRQWRADRLFARAWAYADAGDWESARDSAVASNNASGSIEASRFVLKAEREVGGAIEYSTARSLFGHGEATSDDRADVLEAMIDAGDPLAAAVLAQSLSDADRLDAGVRKQLVRLHVRSRRYLEAVTLADVTTGSEYDPELDLVLAEELAGSGEARLQVEMVDRLHRVLAAPADETARGALLLIASLPEGWVPSELAAKAVERFGKEVDLEVSDRLRLAHLQLRLGHARREEVIEAAVQAYRGTHLPELVAWLTRLEEFTKVIELTDRSSHPQVLSGDLFMHRVRALEVLGRFEQMSAELEDVSAPLDPAILMAYRALAAAKLGNQPRAMLYWKNAFERAEIEVARNYYFQLAAIAKTAGLPERQFEALARGIEHPFGAPPPVRELGELFDWLYKQGNTKRLLSVTYRLLHREPEDPMLINNYYFLRALHEGVAPEAIEEIEALLENTPASFELRHTLAFLHLRSGDPQAALAVLDASGIEAGELVNEGRAVYSAALAALDRIEEARALADSVDWSKLSSAERRLLRDGAEAGERKDLAGMKEGAERPRGAADQ